MSLRAERGNGGVALCSWHISFFNSLEEIGEEARRVTYVNFSSPPSNIGGI